MVSIGCCWDDVDDVFMLKEDATSDVDGMVVLLCSQYNSSRDGW